MLTKFAFAQFSNARFLISQLKERASATLGSSQFSLLIAFLLVAFYNAEFFSALVHLTSFQHLRGPLFVLNVGLLLWLVTFCVISLLNFPVIGKLIASLLLVTAALAAYFMDAYGILIHRMMIQNLVETDPGEVRSLLNLHLIVYFLGLGLAPAWLVTRIPVSYERFAVEIWKKCKHLAAASIAICLLIASMSADYASFFRNHKDVRQMANPLNVIYAGSSYLSASYSSFAHAGTRAVTPIGKDAKVNALGKSQSKPTLFILVVGETARADHFALNGYERDTTPLLAQQALVNFSKVSSCGTETAVSVPCMFSGLGRSQYSDRKAKSQESLLDVINHAGIPVLWRDNNSSCKGTCNRVGYEDMQHLQIPELCNERECFDEVLLHRLNEITTATPGSQFIVLHQKGSHGPDYFNRYPTTQEFFQPVCKTNQLQHCTRQEVVNGFDNTIRYTDYFLNSTIEWLKGQQQNYHTALLYLSDHGESLGEQGLYLHGMPYAIAPAAQKQVPMLMWLSPDFAQANKIDAACLTRESNQAFSQDNLFHTLLGLMNIETTIYDGQLDIVKPCRAS